MRIMGSIILQPSSLIFFASVNDLAMALCVSKTSGVHMPANPAEPLKRGLDSVKRQKRTRKERVLEDGLAATGELVHLVFRNQRNRPDVATIDLHQFRIVEAQRTSNSLEHVGQGTQSQVAQHTRPPPLGDRKSVV